MRKRAKFALILTGIIITLVTILCPRVTLFSQGESKAKVVIPTLHSPVRIVQIPNKGKLLVSDYSLGMILLLDQHSLQVIRAFPINGKPLGIAFANGMVLVGNETKKVIEVYKTNGVKIGKLGIGTAQPMDIALDLSVRRIFVVDGGQKAVKVYDPKKKLVRKIPASAPDANILTNPSGIAVDTVNQEILVSDYGDQAMGIYARIQIFNYNGDLIDTISGKQGMMGQRFSRPQGLAVDSVGHIFMVDCFSGEIMVFERSSGALIKTIGSYGTGPGQLRLPFDLVIDPVTKNIYVTNNRMARIEVFPQGGEL